ncbi:MAG: hypothetical protein LUF90_04075 [Rikenellaceae bacterium]|nr:hypothetical protein [Rikenellaceae bacterium]
MKNDQINNESCDTCNEDFQRGVDSIVDRVDGYNRKEHRNKKKEVEEAFDTDTRDNTKLSDIAAAGTAATAGLAGAGASDASRIQDGKYESGKTDKYDANACGVYNTDDDINATKFDASDIRSENPVYYEESCGCGDDTLEDSSVSTEDKKEKYSANTCGTESIYSDNRETDGDIKGANKYTDSTMKSEEDMYNDNMCGCGDDNMENSFRDNSDIAGMYSVEDDMDAFDDSNDLIAVVEEINIYEFDSDDDNKNN